MASKDVRHSRLALLLAVFALVAGIGTVMQIAFVQAKAVNSGHEAFALRLAPFEPSLAHEPPAP
jgi:hypothetical protein